MVLIELADSIPSYKVANNKDIGTLLVSHTFDNDLLPQLLAVGRRHGVKLAAVLHAALLQTVHELSDDIPGSDDLYKSGSALDLRNGWMVTNLFLCPMPRAPYSTGRDHETCSRLSPSSLPSKETGC